MRSTLNSKPARAALKVCTRVSLIAAVGFLFSKLTLPWEAAIVTFPVIHDLLRSLEDGSGNILAWSSAVLAPTFDQSTLTAEQVAQEISGVLHSLVPRNVRHLVSGTWGQKVEIVGVPQGGSWPENAGSSADSSMMKAYWNRDDEQLVARAPISPAVVVHEYGHALEQALAGAHAFLPLTETAWQAAWEAQATKALWPTLRAKEMLMQTGNASGIPASVLDCFVSPYAARNPAEFFAECFRAYLNVNDRNDMPDDWPNADEALLKKLHPYVWAYFNAEFGKAPKGLFVPLVPGPRVCACGRTHGEDDPLVKDPAFAAVAASECDICGGRHNTDKCETPEGEAFDDPDDFDEDRNDERRHEAACAKPVRCAALVYQAGIANVFEVKHARTHPADRVETRRLYQGQIISAANFALGLKLAGAHVTTFWINAAGDISQSTWEKWPAHGIPDAPFAEQYLLVGDVPRHAEAACFSPTFDPLGIRDFNPADAWFACPRSFPACAICGADADELCGKGCPGEATRGKLKPLPPKYGGAHALKPQAWNLRGAARETLRFRWQKPDPQKGRTAREKQLRRALIAYTAANRAWIRSALRSSSWAFADEPTARATCPLTAADAEKLEVENMARSVRGEPLVPVNYKAPHHPRAWDADYPADLFPVDRSISEREDREIMAHERDEWDWTAFACPRSNREAAGRISLFPLRPVIVTKRLPATDHKGARIRATGEFPNGKPVSFERGWDWQVSPAANHAAAAHELRLNHNLGEPFWKLEGGEMPGRFGGYVWILVP